MAVSKKKAKAKAPAKKSARAAVKKTPAKIAAGKKSVGKAPVKTSSAKKAATPKKNVPAKKSVHAKESASTKKSAPGKKTAPVKAAAGKAGSTSLVSKVTAAVKATVKASTDMVDKFLHPELHKLVTPLEDRILVQAEKAPTQTAGGLHIPTTSETKPSRGKVIAVGKGKRSKKGAVRPLDVAVGDFVLFAEYAGQSVTLDGADYLILREEDVLGVSES